MAYFQGWLGLNNSGREVSKDSQANPWCWLLLPKKTLKFFRGKTKMSIAGNFFGAGVPKLSQQSFHLEHEGGIGCLKNLFQLDIDIFGFN